MKYIKKYESISGDIKRGDIIISEDYDRKNKGCLYLILNDVPGNNRKLLVYKIGDIEYGEFNILNSYDRQWGIHNIYKNENIRLLNYNEKMKIVKDIYHRIIDNIYYKEVIDYIKDITGINLTDMPEYKEYAEHLEMLKKSKKYNI